MSDFISCADRMAAAIEKAMPLIVDMWASFPYAEQPEDDDVMTELRRAAQAWREFQSDMMTLPPTEDSMTDGGPAFAHADVHIRVIDQRIGMGVGGHDTVVRAYHVPTGILVEVPRSNRGQHHDRQTALEMIEYAIAARETGQ